MAPRRAETRGGSSHPATLRRFLERLLTGALALSAIVALLGTMLWRDRVRLEAIAIPTAPSAIGRGDGVTVTWFGVATLLFDDGDTQILVDGFISRPSALAVLTRLPVTNDVARINWFLNEYQVLRLGAIVPVHSHFDHAMDVGAIANRTGALVLGSGSSAAIARGAGVPGEQIIVAGEDDSYTFGRFTVRLIRSPHAPVGWSGSIPLPGDIDEPLAMPAPVTAFREGRSFALLISHPDGKALVLGSAGFSAESLANVRADTVFLGVGLLESLGRDYMTRYWQTAVTATGARTVIPIHFEDYTQPFGTIRLAPKILDDFSVTARILEELRQRWDGGTQIYLPEFGVPMPLRPEPSPAT
jgi:L-ascorbate metabolism protein UlaG (beta-lactamase superfamily)